MSDQTEIDERKSRSLTNRPTQKQTVLKFDGVELVLSDDQFEGLFNMLKAIEPHLLEHGKRGST